MFSGETANILNYGCPACNASDRDRLYALYFNKFLEKADKAKKYNLLEMAPSSLRIFLKRQPNINYRCSDLYMKDVDDVVDITDMKLYENGRFDIFVCSHILEHVKDDRKAVSELYRILKPGGWGIAMVPIVTTIEETLEDDKIVSEADRWKYYGQNDHVRQYSRKGFVRRLEEGGFKVRLLGVDFFGKELFEKSGVHKRSVLYIVEKL
jgi:predicted SAM-dependent methyltransferase